MAAGTPAPTPTGETVTITVAGVPGGLLGGAVGPIVARLQVIQADGSVVSTRVTLTIRATPAAAARPLVQAPQEQRDEALRQLQLARGYYEAAVDALNSTRLVFAQETYRNQQEGKVK